MPEPDISLKTLIVRTKEYLSYLLGNWYWIVLAAAVVGGVLAYRAYREPVNYRANLTFSINEKPGGGGGGGVGSIISQFGFSGAGSEYNFEKILLMAESQLMINNLLLDSATVDGRGDLIANHIIIIYELEEAWELAPSPEGIVRLSTDSLPALSREERKLLKGLYNFTVFSSSPLVTTTLNETAQVIYLTAETRHEELSMVLSQGVYRRLSNFYMEESTGNSRATLAKLNHKVDSLLAELNSAEYRSASLSDSRLNLKQRTNYIEQARLNRKVQIMQVAYTEALRNKETAAFALETSRPFFKTIDEPFYPLDRVKDNYIKQALIGGLIGAVAAAVTLALIYGYRLIMAETAVLNPQSEVPTT